MKTQTLLLALAAAPATLAHTVWTTFYVDGVSQGDGVAMRMRQDLQKASNPLEDLSSNDMACNVGGDKGVSRVQSVQDGSTLSFEFRSWPDDPTREPIDRRHYGPCALYLKKVDSAIEDKGYGDGWFKLMDAGYDSSTKQWCTDKLIDNKGLLSAVLPKGLASGYYLARPEILALHAVGDPQFYAGCAQIFVQGGGNLGPEKTVSIPGYVKAGEPSVSFNIYNTDGSKYTVPGPAVAKLVSSGASGNTKVQTSQTEGQKPEGCIVENANWCGKEIPSYSDEAGCWASDADCWKQQDACYKSVGPVGNKGCQIWQEKCTANQAQCKSGNFNGPPNKGKVLTPQPSKVNVGTILATSGGGQGSGSTPQTSAGGSSPSATSQPASASAATSASYAASSSVSYKKEAEAKPTGDSIEAPKHTTITLAASEGAPAPTGAACPSGFKCHTVYKTVVETKIEYKTVYADLRRRTVHQRRHGHIY